MRQCGVIAYQQGFLGPDAVSKLREQGRRRAGAGGAGHRGGLPRTESLSVERKLPAADAQWGRHCRNVALLGPTSRPAVV